MAGRGRSAAADTHSRMCYFAQTGPVYHLLTNARSNVACAVLNFRKKQVSPINKAHLILWAPHPQQRHVCLQDPVSDPAKVEKLLWGPR